MRLGEQNIEFLHHAPHRFTDTDNVIVRYLALDWRCVVGVPAELARGGQVGVVIDGGAMQQVTLQKEAVVLTVPPNAKTVSIVLRRGR